MSATHLTTMAALAFLIVVLGAGHLLDEPQPYTAAQADAIAAAKAEVRRERGARDLCRELHGPSAAHLWDAAGSLVCITRRGEVVAASTEGN